MPLSSHLQSSFLLAELASLSSFFFCPQIQCIALRWRCLWCWARRHGQIADRRISVGRRLPWCSSYWVGRSTACDNAFAKIRFACCWYVDFFFAIYFFVAICANLISISFLPLFWLCVVSVQFGSCGALFWMFDRYRSLLCPLLFCLWLCLLSVSIVCLF